MPDMTMNAAKGNLIDTMVFTMAILISRSTHVVLEPVIQP